MSNPALAKTRRFGNVAVMFSCFVNNLVTGALGDTDISATMKNIESSAEVLKDLLNNVQSGTVFAGTMLKNEQPTTNVQAIANNLAVALSNLNRLGRWRFLWHRELLRTNAPAAAHNITEP
ncbi:MAG: hypothetical protein WBN75_10400 [Verrucomicrobiia bacterium]|jgi:hypothetical protein